MDKLLSSRTRHDEQLISVGDISPEKYGKSAFCNLQYTPSKLVDNVLFKQVSTMKKVEEESQKNRQFEAINDCLMDKLKYMEEEKNVIINSLNQQITVYKKIIKEMQQKNEDRIKQLQRKFNSELSKILSSKQEEVKFVQSEKQLLQNKIQQLELTIEKQKQKIDSHDRSVADLKSGHERMEKQVQNLNFKIKQKVQEIQEIEQRNRVQLENLQRKLLQTQMDWKEQLREALNRKEIEIEAMEKSHQQDIGKYQELRQIQDQAHKKQTTEIIQSYQKQLKKLSQLIGHKQRTIESLSRDHKQEKSKNLNLTKTFESELGELTRFKLLNSELQSENDKLRQLLIESSKQLQRCREEFLALDRQNSTLRIKAKSADEEARTWRESYYMSKRN